ncbi:MAG: GtrA family protein [Coriobacteriia bacterium]|nr:GtrA family protein [Coriobacteriia bacterium]
MKKLLAQIAKFGVVGIIAFFIDWGIFNVVLIAGTISAGEQFASQEWFTLVATTTGFTVSVIFNYIASMKYVFKHKEDMNRAKEFIIFVVLSIIGLAINNFVVWGVAHGIPWPFEVAQLLKDNVAKIVATAIVMVWNFVTRKILLDAGD